MDALPVLIIGYGNFDREDDGVAWHILSRLASRLALPFPNSPEEYEFLPGGKVDLFFALQLYPEMAETLGNYARVCFVDAHTGAVPDEVHVEHLAAEQQPSPFTHHMTAATLLAMSKNLYKKQPDAYLISVRGYQFEFFQRLSPRTDSLANQAVDWLATWIGQM
jgi:hydrogenase maturation protease